MGEENSTFDQIIARVRHMLTYGVEISEIVEAFAAEGYSREEVYLAVVAATLLNT